MRSITVTTDFTWNLEVAPGKFIPDIECCCTASVFPGTPASYSGPGCGPTVYGYRDIKIDCGGYDREAGLHVPDYVEPDADLTRRILNWLSQGHADDAFADAANGQGFGPDQDYIRDLRRESA
jgi:hypothetical protein